MANQQLYHIQDGTGQTTDGTTQVVMVSLNTATAAPGGGALNNCSIFVNGTGVGFNSGSGKGSGERVAALFKIVAGTLTQVGTTDHVTGMLSDEAGGNPNTGFSISGTTIQYWIIGSTGATINWLARIDFTIYQNA